MNDERMKVGIDFATGRKHFQRVLRSYVYNWKESELVDRKELTLNLFVAYDLNYKNTKKANYTRISSSVNELLFSKHFMGQKEVEEEKRELIKRGIVDSE